MRMSSFFHSSKKSSNGVITGYFLVGLAVVLLFSTVAAAQQKIDEEYTRLIRENTYGPFTTKYVDYLPYSKNVPTPLDVLGHIAGAPDVLTYTKDIYRYMRTLDEASDRVKVFSIGTTEEGREMIVVLISDKDHIKNLDKHKEMTAKLADPRTISESEAEDLIEDTLPFYMVLAGLHSGETGSPEMHMELAYRLAVDESPFIRDIRKNSIIMLVPAAEPDGRDKIVDLHMAKRIDPDAVVPSRLIWWGAYVAHDNNRDALSLSLESSKNVNRTFLEYKPQVLHDLHESASHLYVSTGTGPYNAWYDPIVINEWQSMAYVEISEMTKLGVPGVWTHNFFDGWGAMYMSYAANSHNAIGRFYETQGARDASTRDIGSPGRNPQRAWFRPNPPLSFTKWSIRNNNNIMQSALLIGMHNTAVNRKLFMENFYLKSKRSVEKATTEGPAAYVFPASDTRKFQQARLLNLLRLQGVEVHKANSSFTVEDQTFGAGSYVVRLDQPYSRAADIYLDKQYYNPNDPRPYDDTGWTLGPLYNAKTVRIEDVSILSVSMTMMDEIKPEGGVKVLTHEDDQNVSFLDERKPIIYVDGIKVQSEISAGSLMGSPASGGLRKLVVYPRIDDFASTAYLINYNAENNLITLRFRKKDLTIHGAEESFSVGGVDFSSGTFILRSSENPGDLEQQLDEIGKELGFIAYGVSEVPDVGMHEIEVPRIALVHNWYSTQTEGWIRIAFDEYGVEYDYLGLQKIRDNSRLRSDYDVIIFGPMSMQRMLNGVAGDNPIPYKKTELTPNIGRQDETDDIRGGIEFDGVVNLQNFVKSGGVLITMTSATEMPIHFFFAQGLSRKDTEGLWARGGVYKAIVDDRSSPIVYGYDNEVGVYFRNSPVFNGGRATGGPFSTTARPSGRGGPDDADIIQGRDRNLGQPSGSEGQPVISRRDSIQNQPQRNDGFARGRSGRGGRGGGAVQYKTILSFNSNSQDLLISGGMRNGEILAGTPAIVDAKMGDGHTLLFSINPFWRGETQGSYAFVFNALLHYNDLK